LFSKILPIILALVVASLMISCSTAEPATQASPSAIPAIQTSLSTSPEGQVTLPASPTNAEVATSTPSAVYIFSQPPRPSGGLLLSSLDYLDESEIKQWVWESFAFDTVQTITEVRWRGGYDPSRRGSGGAVRDFTIEIYPSIPVGAEPDVANLPLVHYEVGDNAGETPAGEVAGMETYDYRFILPTPFEAAPYTPYWIQIEALQTGAPDWGLVQATNGDAQHFRRRVIGKAANYFQLAPGDPAIELLAQGVSGEAPTPGSAASWDREITQQALPPTEVVPINADGIQEVVLVISRSGYTPAHFAVKVGVPVRVIFRQLGYVPGGNILLVRWGSQQEQYLTLDSLTDTEILEFTPQEAGDFRFNCPHYWYEGTMTVQE
jgi:hypothetical protein